MLAGSVVLVLGALWWIWAGRQSADLAAEEPIEMPAVDEALSAPADGVGDPSASAPELAPMVDDESGVDPPLVPMEQGSLYSEVRRTLVEAGWTPVEQRDDCGIRCTSMRREGYPETEDCADTGLAPCRFIFASPSGKPLVIATLGEDVRLSGWSEGDPGQAFAGESREQEMRADIAAARFPSYARQAAQEIVSALKARDLGVIADHAHPERGVLFSPYAYIDRASNQVWSAQELRGWSRDTRIRVWGTEDGTGFPIKLTPAGYFERYVFPVDFTIGAMVSVDDDQARGNSVNNASEVFPDGVRIEFYRPPSEGEGGIDWRALRLVFVPVDGEPRLVAIIHDQWTG
jgi:hypothetical protein